MSSTTYRLATYHLPPHRNRVDRMYYETIRKERPGHVGPGPLQDEVWDTPLMVFNRFGWWATRAMSHARMAPQWGGCPMAREGWSWTVYRFSLNDRQAFVRAGALPPAPPPYGMSIGFSSDGRWMFVGCSLNGRWMFAGCSLDVRWVFDGCSMSSRWIFDRWSTDVRWMFDECSLDFRSLVDRCSMEVRWGFDVCSMGVRRMFVGCSLGGRWMFAGCSLDVRWVFDGCPMSARWIFDR